MCNVKYWARYILLVYILLLSVGKSYDDDENPFGVTGVWNPLDGFDYIFTTWEENGVDINISYIYDINSFF